MILGINLGPGAKRDMDRNIKRRSFVKRKDFFMILVRTSTATLLEFLDEHGKTLRFQPYQPPHG